jgi:hypothetical protein
VVALSSLLGSYSTYRRWEIHNSIDACYLKSVSRLDEGENNLASKKLGRRKFPTYSLRIAGSQARLNVAIEMEVLEVAVDSRNCETTSGNKVTESVENVREVAPLVFGV